MPDPPKTTLGEWGRRLYVDKAVNYFRQMRRRAPHKAFLDQNSEKHSEFKKPYKSKNYDSMEYNRGPRRSTYPGYPDWPTNPLSNRVTLRGAIVEYCDFGFYNITHCNGWFRVEVTFPKINYILRRYGKGKWEITGAVSRWVQGKRWNIIHILPDPFKRETHGPYSNYAIIKVKYARPDGPKGECVEEKKILCCPGDPNIYMDDSNPDTMEAGESVNISGGGGIPPYTWAIVEGSGFTLDDTVSPVLISAGGSAEDYVTVRVTDSCEEYADQTISICPAVETFEYDDTNSAETIDQGDTEILYVLGGSPPFTWNLSQENGSGFSLGATVTTERYNTLIASISACGTADITVTDACEDEVVGIVRCTEGEWGYWPEPGSSTSYAAWCNILSTDSGYWADPGPLCYAYKVPTGAYCDPGGDDEIIQDNKKWSIFSVADAHFCWELGSGDPPDSWPYSELGGDCEVPVPPGGVGPTDFGPEGGDEHTCDAYGSGQCICLKTSFVLELWYCG